METIAPISLAEKWDNSGIQIGDRRSPVNIVCVSLDPSPDAVKSACDIHADVLITHHPLIFNPLKYIDQSKYPGSVIQMAIQHRLAIYTAHTNLDSVSGGINDLLCRYIGLHDTKVLVKSSNASLFKLIVYAPKAFERQILEAIFDTPAGEIGNYSCCTFRNSGIGTFKPGETSKPFIGKPGNVSHADEIRIETVAYQRDLDAILNTIRRHHPYETMAYDIYPIVPVAFKDGIGRIGEIEEAASLSSIARSIKEKIGLNTLRIVGNPDLMVKKIAVCSGSGGSLLNEFFASGADVFVSGDFKYHEARDVEMAGRGLIDIGHFASEHIIVTPLAKRLQECIAEAEYDVQVVPCMIETDPFSSIF